MIFAVGGLDDLPVRGEAGRMLLGRVRVSGVEDVVAFTGITLRLGRGAATAWLAPLVQAGLQRPDVIWHMRVEEHIGWCLGKIARQVG